MSRLSGPALIERLKPIAREACKNAHAPYSRFPVGAAILTRAGEVFGGCNVENASFGLTICAERNVLAQAIAKGAMPGDVKGLLIYTPGTVAHSPCGACRQVMHELLGKEAQVISCCDADETQSWKLDALMPDPFEF